MVRTCPRPAPSTRPSAFTHPTMKCRCAGKPPTHKCPRAAHRPTPTYRASAGNACQAAPLRPASRKLLYAGQSLQVRYQQRHPASGGAPCRPAAQSCAAPGPSAHHPRHRWSQHSASYKTPGPCCAAAVHKRHVHAVSRAMRDATTSQCPRRHRLAAAHTAVWQRNLRLGNGLALGADLGLHV